MMQWNRAFDDVDDLIFMDCDWSKSDRQNLSREGTTPGKGVGFFLIGTIPQGRSTAKDAAAPAEQRLPPGVAGDFFFLKATKYGKIRGFFPYDMIG